MADQLKQLKIKTGILRRTLKELDGYRAEVQQLRAKVEKLHAENAEPHYLAKQTEVLHESEVMIPDTKKRLEGALADLQQLVSQCSGKAGVSDSEDFEKAKACVAEAEEKLASDGAADQ